MALGSHFSKRKSSKKAMGAAARNLKSPCVDWGDMLLVGRRSLGPSDAAAAPAISKREDAVSLSNRSGRPPPSDWPVVQRELQTKYVAPGVRQIEFLSLSRS